MLRTVLGSGRRRASLAVAVAGVLVCGCSREKTADVTGVVRVNGKPPNTPGLTINFLGPTGVPATAPVALDGKYTAGLVPVGEVFVGLTVINPAADEAQLAKDLAGPNSSVASKGKPPTDDPLSDTKMADRAGGVKSVPARYNDPRLSGLRLVTQPGPNVYDIDLN